MPASTAAATFTLKNFNGALPSGTPDVGIISILKKQQGDTTFTFAFSDASLRDPKTLTGMTVGVEKPLGDGVKAAVSYDLAKRAAIGYVTLDKPLNGSDLQLRAVYKQASDEFILEETWKFDKNNKLSGSYNFASEEASFAYTYTKDDWSATGRYNFQKDTTVLEVSKKEGKATFGATYALKDQAATLSWAAKPFKAVLKGNVGRGGVKATQVVLVATHEFDL